MTNRRKFGWIGFVVGVMIAALIIKFDDLGTAMGAPIGLFVLVIMITILFSMVGGHVDSKKK